jgi:hypothetical protein
MCMAKQGVGAVRLLEVAGCGRHVEMRHTSPWFPTQAEPVVAVMAAAARHSVQDSGEVAAWRGRCCRRFFKPWAGGGPPGP